jgi:hypothetical protein
MFAGELLLAIAAIGAITFVAYWTGRRHGEGDRDALLEELDYSQDLIVDLLGQRKNTHPTLRVINGQ